MITIDLHPSHDTLEASTLILFSTSAAGICQPLFFFSATAPLRKIKKREEGEGERIALGEPDHINSYADGVNTIKALRSSLSKNHSIDCAQPPFSRQFATDCLSYCCRLGKNKKRRRTLAESEILFFGHTIPKSSRNDKNTGLLAARSNRPQICWQRLVSVM